MTRLPLQTADTRCSSPGSGRWGLSWSTLRGLSLRGLSLRGLSLRGLSLRGLSLRGLSLLWLTLLWLLPLTGLAGEPSRGAPTALPLPPWQLLPSWSCAVPLVECSRFYPRQTEPVLETVADGTRAKVSLPGRPLTQSWSSPVALVGDGRLEVAPGDLILQAPDGGQVHLTGPGTFYLTRGQLIPLAQMDGRYRHTVSERPTNTPPTPRTPILVPPLVAGPDGTVVDFVMTREGHVALQVLEGRIHVQWLDDWSGTPPRAPTRDPQPVNDTLVEGEGLVLEPSGLNGRTWYRLSADAARDHLAHLRRVLRTQARSGSRAGTSEDALSPEAAHAAFLRDLPSLAPTEVEAALARLMQHRSDPNLTPRALYFAWLKLDGEAQPAARARIAALLHTRYPDSPWGQMVSPATAPPLSRPQDSSPTLPPE